MEGRGETVKFKAGSRDGSSRELLSQADANLKCQQ
jgi:hypothetical protein